MNVQQQRLLKCSADSVKVFWCFLLLFHALMRCYIIVRHQFGTQFHRNTPRNRRIAEARRSAQWDKDKPETHVKKGRAFRGVGSFGDGDVLYDPVDMSFLLFTGACIETWNKEREDGKRRCAYGEIFYEQKEPPQGQKYPYRYPKVSDELFGKLAKSNFPPPLLAVATCDVIPLNLLTKGERYSSSKNTFAAKVKELASKPGGEWFEVAKEISDAHFRGDTNGKTVSAAGRGRRDEFSHVDLENVPDETGPDFYADIDARNGWVEPGEKEPAESRAVAWNPRDITHGTKVQNLTFHGRWKISRRMASYWRKNCAGEYSRCCDFIRQLLEKPWPRAPSLEGWASTAPLFNALLAEDLKRTKTATSQAAALLTPAGGR